MTANRENSGGKAVLYLDDLVVGQRFVSGTHLIDEQQIKAFAKQFDPQPFHLDDARRRHCWGWWPSGWHTAGISMRLLVEGIAHCRRARGAGAELTWPKPTRPGPSCRSRRDR